MRFHLRSVSTVAVLLAVLVTPSFSGLRDKGIKVQTVAVEGLNVSDGVALADYGRYALLARYNDTELASDELITLENKSSLNNRYVSVFDSQDLEKPRTFSLGDVYFPELFFDPATSLAYFLGTDFVKAGPKGDEIAAIDVMGYMVLSLNDEKPNAGSQLVRVEIPTKPETDDSAAAEEAPTIALVGDNTIAFTKGRNLFVYGMINGTIATYDLGSIDGSQSAVSIVGSHQKAGVLAIANQITVSGEEGKSPIHKTELKFVRVKKDGTISLIRAFSPEGICLVRGSTVVFREDAEGSPQAGYCVDNMGGLLEFGLAAGFEDQVGTATYLAQFPGLAQDPSQPYETLSPRFLQFDSAGNIVLYRPGRQLIRRPAFGRPTGSAGIRRPAFVTSEERAGVSLGRLLKNKRGESKVLIVGDLSSAIGDNVSALVRRPDSGWWIVGESGIVFSLAFSPDEATAQLTYEVHIGPGVVSAASAGDRIAAIRASGASVNTESGTSAPESSALVMARMKREKGDPVSSTVAFSVAQAGASFAAPSAKKSTPSIRRPCNVERGR